MIRFSRGHLVMPAAVALATGAMVGLPTATGSPAAAGTSAASSQNFRVQRTGSTSAMPGSAVVKGGGGAVNLTEDGKLKRYANRSNSPRPRVVRRADGTRTLTRAAAPSSWLPVVTPRPVDSTRPGAVKGWEGLNENDNQTFAGFNVEPPDQGLCAGGGHVLEMINSTVRVYSTGGTPQRTAYLNDFFKEPGYQFTTDPSCVFDAGKGRYYATELTLDIDPKSGSLTGRNWIDLAVSKTNNALNGWNVYKIPVTDDGSQGTPAHRGCPCIGDYPHLATDSHGVFITTNEYPFSDAPGVFGNNFNGAQVYALSKSKAAAGASEINAVHFSNVRVPSTSGPLLIGFTLWPAQSAGTGYARENNGTIYFASSFAAEEARPGDFTGHGSKIGSWWIGNTASLDTTPHLVLREKTLAVGSYGVPPLSDQKAGPVPLRDCLAVNCRDLGGPYPNEQEGALDSSDSRVLTAVYANGMVMSALDTAMQVSGNVQAGFEWVAVNAASANSTLARRGYVGVAGGNATFPSFATNKSGAGYAGFSLVGNYRYPSAGYTKLSPAGPSATLHVAGAGAAPEDGFCEYRAFNCGGTDTPTMRPRWGDYGYAAWDGANFYLANEYIAHRCSYSEFNKDTTCGGTRTFYGNFSTHVQKLS